jgi:hypothetical protein
VLSIAINIRAVGADINRETHRYGRVITYKHQKIYPSSHCLRHLALPKIRSLSSTLIPNHILQMPSIGHPQFSKALATKSLTILPNLKLDVIVHVVGRNPSPFQVQIPVLSLIRLMTHVCGPMTPPNFPLTPCTTGMRRTICCICRPGLEVPMFLSKRP